MTTATRTIKVGDIVKPTNTGVDHYNRTQNWGVYRGRVVALWTMGIYNYAEVVWFRDARQVFGNKSTYDADMLTTA